MFDSLRKAFSNAAKSLGEKELNEKDIEDILFELEISLLESDVAGEVIDSIKSDLKEKLIGSKVDKNEIEKFVKDNLISIISSLFDSVGDIDIFEKIDEKKKKEQPFLIVFVGINGTGKTTSLAKFASLLQEKKYSVVVAAADTFRAGAIEQLREHTNRLNLKLVAQNYESDPAAVARDAVLYAKSHKTDCVLIDTAGRMQTSKNLMEQIAKITKVVNPDMTIFVGDSLAGNDTVNQAREFHNHVKFDGSILTKSDADAKGGAALSIAKVTSTPVLYLGTGQEYSDLKSFDKNIFLETVFGSLNDVKIEQTDVSKLKESSTLEPEPVPEPEPVVQQVVNCGPGTESVNGVCQVIKAEEPEESEGGGCLIATATYGSELAPQVQMLREIRDNQLMNTESGSAFMNTFNEAYYSFSPYIADLEREHPLFKEAVKAAITPMLSTLSIMESAETESEVLGLGLSVIALNLAMYIGLPAFGIVKVIQLRKN